MKPNELNQRASRAIERLSARISSGKTEQSAKWDDFLQRRVKLRDEIVALIGRFPSEKDGTSIPLLFGAVKTGDIIREIFVVAHKSQIWEKASEVSLVYYVTAPEFSEEDEGVKSWMGDNGKIVAIPVAKESLDDSIFETGLPKNYEYEELEHELEQMRESLDMLNGLYPQSAKLW